MADRNLIDSKTLLREIRECLPAPLREERSLDGSIVMVGGDHDDVVVRVSGNKVSVADFSVRWETPYTSIVQLRCFATLNWRRLPASTLVMTLHDLIRAAYEVRVATYRRCERCGEMKPPECMDDDKTCDSCAPPRVY
jgi:hypothetical protein